MTTERPAQPFFGTSRSAKAGPRAATSIRGRRSPLAGWIRLARIAALGGASMLLAAGAHLAGGGHLPSPAVLGISTFLVGLTAVTLTARRLRLVPLTLALGIEQVLLHAAFDATAMSGAGCAGGSLAGHTTAMSGCLAGSHPLAIATGPGTGMVLAHVAATLATAWLLAIGERRWWQLCARIVRAATVAPTRRTRRLRLSRPRPVAALAAANPDSPADPRGPPALAWSG